MVQPTEEQAVEMAKDWMSQLSVVGSSPVTEREEALMRLAVRAYRVLERIPS